MSSQSNTPLKNIPTSQPAKPKREIDVFLKEIINQDPALGPYEASGSYDNVDATTTNLYVGHLAPSVTEEQLLDLFGEYGDISSVKIMWPRSEEERAKKKNCGFVLFKRRQDAADAKVCMIYSFMCIK